MEPERPIEKLLQAYAKKRREQAEKGPFEMPGATHEILRREVSRKFRPAAGEPTSFWSSLAVLWPRLAWGFAILAILAIITAVLLPTGARKGTPLTSRDEQRISSDVAFDTALTTPSPAAAVERESIAPPPEQPATAKSFAAETDAKKDVQLRDESAPSTLTDLGAQAAPVPQRRDPSVAPPSDLAKSKLGTEPLTLSERAVTVEADNFRQKEAETTIRSRRFQAEPVAPPTVPPATESASAPADPLSTAPRIAVASPSVTQSGAALSFGSTGSANFSRFNSEQFKNTAAPQAAPAEKLEAKSEGSVGDVVLASFELQQTNGNLRVVDGDGSVYLGRMLFTEALSAGEAGRRPAPTSPPSESQRSLAAAAAVNTQAENFSFRVEGTNLTLNQRVVFNASVVATNAGVSNSVAGVGGGFNNPPQPLIVPAGISRISGRATVGDRREIEVEAIKVPSVKAP